MHTQVSPRFADRPIALVGMMGSGKTTLGRKLAKKLGRRFIDSDHEIEARLGVTIAEVFERSGEAWFREYECRVIGELVERPDLVLATGGGAVTYAPTRAALQEHATTVWLKISGEALWERLRGDTKRPLLQTPDPRARLLDLLEARAPFYAEAALTLDIEGHSVGSALKELVEMLEDK